MGTLPLLYLHINLAGHSHSRVGPREQDTSLGLLLKTLIRPDANILKWRLLHRIPPDINHNTQLRVLGLYSNGEYKDVMDETPGGGS